MKTEKLVRWLHVVLSVMTGIGMLEIFAVIFAGVRELKLQAWGTILLIVVLVALGLFGGTMCGRWARDAYRALAAFICNLRRTDNFDKLCDSDLGQDQIIDRLMNDVDDPGLLNNDQVATCLACGVIGTMLVVGVNMWISEIFYDVGAIIDAIYRVAILGSSIITVIFLLAEAVIRLVVGVALEILVERKRGM